MFSSRLNINTEENGLSRLLSEKRKSGERILDLTESNPTKSGFDYPDNILDAIRKRDSIYYKPDPKGIQSARDAIRKYYTEKNIEVSAENIFLTSGTSEAYSFVFKLLANPGDEVLISSPGYPLFSFIAELESVNVRNYRLNYIDNCFTIDFVHLESCINVKTKAIILVNPNNPTGNFVKKDELEKLIRVCKKNNIAIICDEVFLDFHIENKAEKYFSFTQVKDVLTFTLSGISKICALPQMKLSWIVVNGADKLAGEAKERLEIIADTYLSVGTPVQLALPDLLESRFCVQNQIINRIKNNNTFLKKITNGTNKLTLFKAEGGWYSVLKLNKEIDEEKLSYAILEKLNVYIHPGYFFDFEEEGFIIVSLLTKEDIFQEGIIKLVEFI